MKITKLLSVTIIASSLFIACKNNDSETQKPQEKPEEVNISKQNNEDSTVVEKVADSIPDQHQYICYTFDGNKEKRIWIEFDDQSIAQRIKYEGQKETIDLKHTKEEFSKGGAHPTIVNYYDEIYKGEVNGTYKLTHSGVWDYVTYIRGKDGKDFNYTIDHEQDPYGSKPCF